MRAMGVMVVMTIMVASAFRLFIAGINVSAACADPAIKDRTTFSAVIVLSHSFDAMVQAMMAPASVVHTVAGLTIMVVWQRGMRTQVVSRTAAAP